MTLHRRSVVSLVPTVMMLALVAAQDAPSGAPRDQQSNPDSLRPREIIIRRTGKVRLVTVAPAAQRAATTQPTAAAQPAAAAQRATKSSTDEGLEYGEHSVRLPLGYDPAENFSPYGPIINLPLEQACGEPYYGGIIGGGACDLGFRGVYGGGYGHGYGRNYGFGSGYGYGATCPPALGFGGGRSSWDYGSGLGYHHASGGSARSSGVWIPSGGGPAYSPSHPGSARWIPRR
jgi:hypothetical protein